MPEHARIIMHTAQFIHSTRAHVIDFDNAPTKGWAKKLGRALFKSFKKLPLDEKIDTDSGAIKRACEPAGGFKRIMTRPVKRDVASRIFKRNALTWRSVLVFDEREMAGSELESAVEGGRAYSVKAVALVRGVPLALHRSVLFGAASFWERSGEFANACRHLDSVPVRHPSAEKFNTTGNDELLARGSVRSRDDEFDFSICVQNPRMEGREKICDFAFIATNGSPLTAKKLGSIHDKGKSMGEWLDRRFSRVEEALARLLPPHMKEGAKIEWILFREM